MESTIFIRKLSPWISIQRPTFNEITRFNNFRTVDPGDFVWAGESYDHFILRRITSKTPKRLFRELSFCYTRNLRVPFHHESATVHYG